MLRVLPTYIMKSFVSHLLSWKTFPSDKVKPWTASEIKIYILFYNFTERPFYLQNIRLHYSIYVLSQGVLLHSDSLLKLPGQFPPSFLRPSRSMKTGTPPRQELHFGSQGGAGSDTTNNRQSHFSVVFACVFPASFEISRTQPQHYESRARNVIPEPQHES